MSSTLASSARLSGPASSHEYLGRGNHRRNASGASSRHQQQHTKAAGHRSQLASSISRTGGAARPGEPSGLVAAVASLSIASMEDGRSRACAGSSMWGWQCDGDTLHGMGSDHDAEIKLMTCIERCNVSKLRCDHRSALPGQPVTRRMVFTLIAHRGLSSSFPENTLVAFDSALERGWASFETDVQLSSDLVPLVCTDQPLLRQAQLIRKCLHSPRRAGSAKASIQPIPAGTDRARRGAQARCKPGASQDSLPPYCGRAHCHRRWELVRPAVLQSAHPDTRRRPAQIPRPGASAPGIDRVGRRCAM